MIGEGDRRITAKKSTLMGTYHRDTMGVFVGHSGIHNHDVGVRMPTRIVLIRMTIQEKGPTILNHSYFV